MIKYIQRGYKMDMKQEVESKYVRHIYGLCNEVTEFKLNNEFFAEWFIKAFEGHPHDSYITEWIERFMKGTPFYYMDKERLEIYINLVKKKTNYKEVTK